MVTDQWGTDLAVNPGMELQKLEAMTYEISQQPNWRLQADVEADYYDGNQLDNNTLAAMQDMGMPPIIVNLIQPTVDAVLGMEAKTRTDWHVSFDNDASEEVANALDVKHKEAARETHADRAVSDAYAHEIKVGLGWVEISRELDPFKYPYRVRSVHRREIWWDWRAMEPDLSDARYLVRRKWIDEDAALAMLPQFKDLIDATMTGWTGFLGFDRVAQMDTNLARSYDIEQSTTIDQYEWRNVLWKRLCFSEVWYRIWKRGYVIKLPGGGAVEFDLNNNQHASLVAAGIAKPIHAVYTRMRMSLWMGPHRLIDIPSPFKHNHFPYVPFWGKREDKSNVPYGLIRSMMSPQDEINARRAKMLYLLSAKRVMVEADALDMRSNDHQQAMEEVGRANAYIVLNPNRANRGGPGLTVDTDFALSEQQFRIMEEAKGNIQETSGVHASMEGQASGAKSGYAINSLIEQGVTTLAEINDNYRFARRQVGELLLSLIRQDMEGVSTVVQVGEGKARKAVALNQPVMHQDGFVQELLNDTAQSMIKVVLEDVPSTPSYRAQQLMQLTELTKALPRQLQALVIDFVISATDLPQRQKIVERIRKAVGIPPDMTPEEEQQQAQAASDAQQKQQAIQDKGIQTQMEQAELKTNLLMEQLKKVQADTEASESRAQLALAQAIQIIDQLRNAGQVLPANQPAQTSPSAPAVQPAPVMQQ